jgi:hypothetical protein
LTGRLPLLPLLLAPPDLPPAFPPLPDPPDRGRGAADPPPPLRGREAVGVRLAMVGNLPPQYHPPQQSQRRHAEG